MVDSEDVNLVDGTVDIGPLFETEIAVSARDVPYASDQRQPCERERKEEDVNFNLHRSLSLR